MRSFWKEGSPDLGAFRGERVEKEGRRDPAQHRAPARPPCALYACVLCGRGYCRLPHVPSYGSWAAGERVPTGEDHLPQQPRVVGYSPDAIYVIHL